MFIDKLLCQNQAPSERHIAKSMRTTLNIADELLDKAKKLTDIQEKNYLVKLGGTEKALKPIPRRRPTSV